MEFIAMCAVALGGFAAGVLAVHIWVFFAPEEKKEVELPAEPIIQTESAAEEKKEVNDG